MIFGIDSTVFYSKMMLCVISCLGSAFIIMFYFEPKKSRLLTMLVSFCFYPISLAASTINYRIGNGETELQWLYIFVEILIGFWPFAMAATMKARITDSVFCAYFTNSINPIMYLAVFLGKAVSDLPALKELYFFKYGFFSQIVYALSLLAFVPIVKKVIVSRMDKIPRKIVWGWVIMVPASQIFPIMTNHFNNDLMKSDFFYIFAIGFGSIVAMCGAVFLIYLKEHSKTERLTTALQYETKKSDYFDIISDYSEQVSKMSHDINNHLRTIQILAANNETEECKKYSQQLIDEYKSKLRSFCINPAVNSLLLYYDRLAKEKNITFDCDVSVEKEILCDSVAIVTVFSNLLDNAFEAAAKCPDNKKVSLSLVQEDNALRAVCANTHAEPIKKKGDKFATSKTDKQFHGLGTQIVKETVKKADGICEYSFDDKTFTATIYMPLKTE